MTLILATPTALYGDRKVTDYYGEACEPIKKIVSNDALICGFAGDFQNIVNAITLVENGEVDPKIIAKVCTGEKQDNAVEGLIIKYGRILVLECKRVWKKPKKTAFCAVGSGATTALAFLSGRLSTRYRAKLTDDDISATFSYVAKVRTDCSKQFDVLYV